MGGTVRHHPGLLLASLAVFGMSTSFPNHPSVEAWETIIYANIHHAGKKAMFASFPSKCLHKHFWGITKSPGLRIHHCILCDGKFEFLLGGAGGKFVGN